MKIQESVGEQWQKFVGCVCGMRVAMRTKKKEYIQWNRGCFKDKKKKKKEGVTLINICCFVLIFNFNITVTLENGVN